MKKLFKIFFAFAFFFAFMNVSKAQSEFAEENLNLFLTNLQQLNFKEAKNYVNDDIDDEKIKNFEDEIKNNNQVNEYFNVYFKNFTYKILDSDENHVELVINSYDLNPALKKAISGGIIDGIKKALNNEELTSDEILQKFLEKSIGAEMTEKKVNVAIRDGLVDISNKNDLKELTKALLGFDYTLIEGLNDEFIEN